MMDGHEPIRLRLCAAQSARWPVLRRFHDKLEATFRRTQRGSSRIHAQTDGLGIDLLRSVPQPERRHNAGEVSEKFMGETLSERTSSKLSHGVKERWFNPQVSTQNPVDSITYTRGTDLGGSLQRAGGIGGLLARSDNSKLAIGDSFASAFYHADGNGNITALMYSSQMLAAKYLYDPYGNTLAMSGPLASANHYRFSTKEWDANPSLYYYGRRFYDPNLQRWLNRDPAQENGGLNLYVFNQNNGIGNVDLLGENAFDLYLKQHGQQVPKTVGGGFGIFGAYALFAIGDASAVMFIPDTCEMAKYKVVSDAGAGYAFGIAESLEFAVYYNDPVQGHASAQSYAGPFVTGQGSWNIFGASFFESEAPSSTGGIWKGMSFNVGFGVSGAAVNEWNYVLQNSRKIRSTCKCYDEILKMP